MVFSSTIFIFAFLPIVLFLYLLAYRFKSIGTANFVLLFASMFFYAWGGVEHFLIIIGVIIINYIFALLIDKYEKYRSLFFILVLAVDIGNLMYFKYANFFLENIRGYGASIALPIGISFYTFQILSYVIDVYTKKIEVQRNVFKLGLYVMMFPQLIAGPIVRYKDVNKAINDRYISYTDIEEGIKRFIIGFFKKVIIANISGGMADAIFAMTGEVNVVYAWLGAICYTLQIYYDFSAYSDMAIGIGRILGFNFNENFNLPYTSKSIQEFWRRWHISLSSWFRDYVYIPLGGNRKGKLRTYINLSIVFLLTGFWHGAAWQFIFWGIYHGFFIIVERLGFKKVLDRLPKIIRHIYTMVVVIIGWVFFRADNMTAATAYVRNMFSTHLNFKSYEVITQLNSIFFLCLAIGIFFSFTKLEFLNKYKWWSNRVFVIARYLCLWIISVLYLIGINFNPFIYFKF